MVALVYHDKAFVIFSEAKNVPVTVPAEYSDHTDVSSPNSTTKLLKHTGINDHLIEMTFQVVRRCSNIVHPQDGR